MKKLLVVVVMAVILVFGRTNYAELYALFFSQFSKEIQSQTSKIDFEIEGNLGEQQEVSEGESLKFDTNNEAFIGVDFDIKNNSDCDIYIRVAIFPIILDKSDTSMVYKLGNSSCQIEYLNKDNSMDLDDEYWEKSDDGYYYYKKAMKEGESLDNKLISGVRLKLNKGEFVDFDDKQLQIALRVEARQDEFDKE